MKKHILLVLVIFLTLNLWSQTIPFTDNELKTFLVMENCIDTDGDNYPDAPADLNGDGAIQITEAESITFLQIGFYNDGYSIASIQDISHFKNLKHLVIRHNDYLTEVSNLGLDSLVHFQSNAQPTLRIVDLSDLPALTDIRVEDMDTLDYLNVQNGSVADYFSLFYTKVVLSACVDDVTEEYNKVLEAMPTGAPMVDCATTATTHPFLKNELKIFPNPMGDFLNIKTDLSIQKVSIFDLLGNLIVDTIEFKDNVDISYLQKGIYLFAILTNEGVVFRKVIKR